MRERMRDRVMRMGLWLALLLIPACAAGPAPVDSGPRLIDLSTLTGSAPDAPASGTHAAVTAVSELVEPLERVTIAADRLFITPTAPPSKTPTESLLALPTADASMPMAAVTAGPTFTPFGLQPTWQFPTGSAPTVVATLPPNCPIPWAFGAVTPPGCPSEPATQTYAAYQSFETRGHMLWRQDTLTIYALYTDGQPPGWESFADTYGGPGIDPDCEPGLDISPYRPSPNHYQPCRGFGKVWRNKTNGPWWRLGWSTMPAEAAYTMTLQRGPDQTLYISDLYGHVHGLAPGGTWTTYRNPAPQVIAPPGSS